MLENSAKIINLSFEPFPNKFLQKILLTTKSEGLALKFLLNEAVTKGLETQPTPHVVVL